MVSQREQIIVQIIITVDIPYFKTQGQFLQYYMHTFVFIHIVKFDNSFHSLMSYSTDWTFSFKLLVPRKHSKQDFNSAKSIFVRTV